MPFIFNMKTRIYYDNAATTSLSKEALEAMMPYLTEKYENPSALYSKGAEIRKLINDARHDIASTIGSFDKEIIFTAGGSEADNLAIIGVAFANRERGRHIISTTIEHHAVLSSLKFLEKNGFRVTYLPVSSEGIVSVDSLKAAICEDTILVSVMYANNEIGTLQPIKEIGELTHERGIIFHTDAVQAYTKIPIEVNDLKIDLMSVSAHKFHGPKGTGFLYVRSGTRLEPVIHGGSQEYGLRAGTENVAGIVGMNAAIKEAFLSKETTEALENEIKAYVKDRISKEIEDVTFNGDTDRSLSGILNFSISGIEGESLLILLDMKGVSASTGSACVQSNHEPSHVIRALGKTIEAARSSIRFSFGRDNTLSEAKEAVDILIESVDYLRKIKV